MAIHRRILEQQAASDHTAFATYVQCLTDTFGRDYVEHLEQWLRAERISVPTKR